jgi:ubiquinone biosynthesis protein Coq4
MIMSKRQIEEEDSSQLTHEIKRIKITEEVILYSTKINTREPVLYPNNPALGQMVRDRLRNPNIDPDPREVVDYTAQNVYLKNQYLSRHK